MRKCVFFDRDGIVNRAPTGRYVERWEDFEIIPAFVEALGIVERLGYNGVVVSNQSGVARGVMTLDAVQEIHRRLRRLLAEQHGLRLLDIFFCPHDEGQCDCRKPRPGMLLAAAEKHGIDLRASWMVGDQDRDVEAGRRAGCRAVLVAPGADATRADVVVPNMDEFVEWTKRGRLAAVEREEQKCQSQ